MQLDSLTSSRIQPDSIQGTGKPDSAIDWNPAEVLTLLDAPFNDLIYRAQSIHRQYHDANGVQLSTLISVKTGGCPEDCGYCPQAARYHTGIENQDMLSLDAVVSAAATAKAKGASRFCMGAAWRGPKQRENRIAVFVKMEVPPEVVAQPALRECVGLDGDVRPASPGQQREAHERRRV